MYRRTVLHIAESHEIRLTGAPCGTARTSRRASARRSVLFVVACIWAVPLGCSDTRIDRAHLQELETAAAGEPVAVRTSDLALAEIKPYTVGPGDVLATTMHGLLAPYSETTVRSRVNDQGDIVLPMVGKVHVAGLTLQAVDRAIIDAHVPKYLQELSVYTDVVAAETTTVLVSGAAAARGPVSLPRNRRNVMYAVAAAGGFAPGTSGRVTVKSLRSDRPPVSYDLSDINDVRRALTGPPLEPGDVVMVEAAETSAVYVTGLVNLPGPIPIPPDSNLPLSRATAAAGGLRDFLEPPEATVWRRLPNGEQVRVRLDLRNIMAGVEEDFALKPGDVLDIPHTADTRVREWALANLRLGPYSLGVHYDPLAQYNFNRALANDNNRTGFGNSVIQSLQFGIPNLLVPQVTPPPTVAP